MDGKKKLNIAERVKNLLSSFVHSSDVNEKTDSVKDSLVKVPQPLPKTSTRHEAFIRRIEGFTTLTWFGKPVQLSPVRCARYGWENTARDVLRCVTCREILYCRLPSPSDENYSKDLAEIELKLIQSHRINCSWRVNPCQGVNLGEIVSDRQSALDQFISRLVSLNITKELPPVSLDFMEQPMCVIDQLKQLLKESNVSGLLGLKDIGTSACLIALCGWAIRAENNDILTCTYCCRKIGIWKYLPKRRDSTDSIKSTNGDASNDSINTTNGNNDSDEPSIKRRRLLNDSKKFDPVNEHKYWCAWLLSSHEDCDDQVKNLPGWKWFLYTLLPDLNPESVRTSQRLIGDIKTTPPHEGLKSIRHLIKDWVSSEDLTLDLDKTLSPKKSSEKKAITP